MELPGVSGRVSVAGASLVIPVIEGVLVAPLLASGPAPEPRTVRLNRTGQSLAVVPAPLTRLSALASLSSVPGRLGLEATPWLARVAYPFVQPVARFAYITLFGGEWHFVPLHRVEPPADLHEESVFGSAMARGSDVDGDGADDVLVACGSPSPRDGRGRILLVSARSNGVLAEVTAESGAHMFGPRTPITCSDFSKISAQCLETSQHGTAHRLHLEGGEAVARSLGRAPGVAIAARAAVDRRRRRGCRC